MNILAGASLARLQPSLRPKSVGIFTVFFHRSGDNCGKYNLNSLRYVVAADDCVLLQCAAISNDCAVHSVNAQFTYLVYIRAQRVCLLEMKIQK